MYKRTIKYTDFNGNERVEDFYFHFSKAELAEMEFSITGGMQQMIEKVTQTQDFPALIKIWKEWILKSYGEKSADGKRFIKSKEMAEAFSQTEAYSQLFLEFANDDEKAAEFLKGVLPSDMREQVEQMEKEGSIELLPEPGVTIE